MTTLLIFLALLAAWCVVGLAIARLFGGMIDAGEDVQKPRYRREGRLA